MPCKINRRGFALFLLLVLGWNMQGSENTKKVIVIGDGFCGKTSLVAKITEGKFINNYHMTIGGKDTP